MDLQGMANLSVEEGAGEAFPFSAVAAAALLAAEAPLVAMPFWACIKTQINWLGHTYGTSAAVGSPRSDLQQAADLVEQQVLQLCQVHSLTEAKESCMQHPSERA